MTPGTQPNSNDYSFAASGGLFHRLLTRTGLAKSGTNGFQMRAGCFILITYIPLLILTLVQGVAYGPNLKVPFFFDVSEATRFLVVGPLLIMSEAFVEPWLVQVVQHVRDRLICSEQLPQYERLVKRAVRCRNSNIAEIVLLIGTFFWQWMDVFVLAPHAGIGTWQVLPSNNEPSCAWFWYIYFAKPLIRFLWLRWLWRYLIWSFFLIRIAFLNLKIMPTHPDRHGGLAFISVGHAKFSVLALTFGAQVASIFGEQVLVDGKTLMSFRYEILGVIMIVLLVFLTPLLAFTCRLLEAKRIGLFEFSALADEYSADFRAKWIDGGRGSEQLLGTSDIQSLADIGNSYEVVHEMRVCLINKDNIMTFLVSTLLPFTPLLLTIYPFDELLNHLLKVVM
jgi:hypothetical protein